MSSKGTIVALVAAGLLVAFFLGRDAGQAPVVFPDVDQGRSEAEMYEAVTAALHRAVEAVELSSRTSGCAWLRPSVRRRAPELLHGVVAAFEAF